MIGHVDCTASPTVAKIVFLSTSGLNPNLLPFLAVECTQDTCLSRAVYARSSAIRGRSEDKDSICVRAKNSALKPVAFVWLRGTKRNRDDIDAMLNYAFNGPGVIRGLELLQWWTLTRATRSRSGTPSFERFPRTISRWDCTPGVYLRSGCHDL